MKFRVTTLYPHKLIRTTTIPWLFALLACLATTAGHAAQPPLKLPQQPLAFEPNQGQTDHQVSYLARGKGYILFLEPAETVLSLNPTSATPKVLRMHLVDAASHARIHGEAVLPGKHNYYIGNDPKGWRTNIPTYGKVISPDVYPGIDMVYHGKQGQLEYDFTVAPQANPHAIRLSFTGNDTMTVNAQGDLLLKVGNEQVVHRAPYAYQTIDGKEVPVTARYAIKGKTVSFKLGHYDNTKPLIIDPALIYASYLGGTGDDEARAVTVDGVGNIYITGQTASSDFPGAVNSASGGNSDAFVTMLDSSGAVQFSTYLGSNGTIGPSDPNNGEPTGEKGNGIAVTSSGKIYVTGGTSSLVVGLTFPTTSGAYQTCGTSAISVFVTVLNSDGSLYYSTCVGSGSSEEGMAIAADSVGNAYVVGWTTSSSFPVTSTAVQSTKKTDPNLRDSFFFKLNPAGGGSNDLVYSTYLGSTLDTSVLGTSLCCQTYATAVAVDSSRIAYVAGWTTNVSTGVLPAAFENLAKANSTYNGLKDAFFYVINPGSASPLQYASYIGGTGDDTAAGIAVTVDGSGIHNIYVGGQTSSTDLAVTSGAYQSVNNGGATNQTDGFVAKYTQTVAGIYDYTQNYLTYLGGTGDDNVNAVAADNFTGRAYVTGQTHSTDFPTASATGIQSGYNVLPDAFVTSLDADGKSLHYSSYLGGSGGDQGLGIVVSQDGKENVYVVGGTSSTDFPITSDAKQNTNNGGLSNVTDAFIAIIGTVADMGVTVNGTNPAPSLLGTMTYTVQVTNHGADTATGVTLSLNIASASSTVPVGSITISPNSSSCAQADPSKDIFVCTLGSMASGTSTTLTFSGTLTAADEVTAGATVQASEKDTDSSNDTATWKSTAGSTTVTPPITVPGGGGSSGGGGGAIGLYALLAMFILMIFGWARRGSPKA